MLIIFRLGHLDRVASRFRFHLRLHRRADTSPRGTAHRLLRAKGLANILAHDTILDLRQPHAHLCISFCIGLLLPAFSISGADGCVHMAEEVRNAALNIPRAFVYTLLINGTMSLAFMVTCLYCITDVDTVLNTPTVFPIIQIFAMARGSNAAATVLDVMMMVIQVCCSFCLLAAASRLAWSFSREDGFPGAKTLAKVSG
jgi:amino acid transporter